MSESDDRIQRALNEAKKKELEERFGGVFGPTDASLPPDVEADWLQDIEEFERRFENVQSTTVRQYLGNPHFEPLAGIPEEDVSPALDRLMDFMEKHGVLIHCFAPEPDDELYRFITEELLDEEIDDIHMEGLTQDFVYEMYHPNPLLDACFYAELFVGKIFRSRPSKLGVAVLPEESWKDPEQIQNLSRVLHALRTYLRDFETFLSSSTTVVACRVVEREAHVSIEVEWSALRKGSMEQFCGSTDVEVDMGRDIRGTWLVSAVRMREHLPEGGSLERA